MKRILFLLTAIFTISLSAQSVNLATSNLKWSGSEVTGKTHFGSLSFSKADLQVSNGDISGGVFEIDMTTLKVEDLTGCQRR
jgi:hypothetical protein